MKKTYHFITDAGHGWLRVPHSDLETLGIAGSITQYSYISKRFAFLEEDCDAGVFLDAAKAAGWAVDFEHHIADWWSGRSRHYRYTETMRREFGLNK